jgi:uncharacterized membrane protein YbhN (UPF0104 family)
MKKNIILNILKISLAAGLIYWLVQSGKLDFNLITEVLKDPLRVFAIILFMLFDHVIVAFRWCIILQTKALAKLPLLKVFKANWIGIFFNSVLPGSVSGDIIKIFYVKELDQKLTKKFLFVSVFLDRVIGLFGLISLGGIISIIFYNDLVTLSPDVEKLIHLNLGLFAIVALSFFFIFFLEQIPHKMAAPFREVKVIGKVMEKLEMIWSDLCSIKAKLIQILIISIIIQTIAAFIFWFIVSPFIAQDFPLQQAMTILPIGMIIISLPIAPAGLGVGHAAFHSLFGYFGITNGASLFNIYFILILITNLTGVIPYVLSSTKKSIKDIELENQE